MPKLMANGLNFHYQQAGSGPDVILIHGVTGDLSIWFLCEAMGVLARSFRVTAFDLRGHGYSDVPRDGYTSADQAGDVLAIMDGLGIERAALVGHSFGAVIATHAAVLYPGRIDGLVLSDPSFPALRHLENLSRWGHWQNFREEAAQAGVTLSDEHWYDLGRFFDQVLHLDGERLLRFRQAVGLPGFNRLLRLAHTTCGDDAKAIAGLTESMIQSVTQPVLAIFGEHSPFLATALYLGQHLAHCVNRLVPGAKHRAPEENGPMFVELVNEYLTSQESTAQLARTTR
ncbi:MAG TPA: alpha/beta hydrolase [Isosphaeraceae bacterium]|nr:alpha/beta hydrolase [Isosphaeraceae bacterium]